MSDPERRILVVDNPVEAAAAIFTSAALDAVGRRGRFITALSGGSTPKKLFERLTAAPYVDAIDWDKVMFLWGDERSVPPDHADSNFAMANQALLKPLRIPEENVFRMQAEKPNLELAASEYEVKLRTMMSEIDFPSRIDLVLLGMGADGHTASLFPGTKALAEKTKWVVANDVSQLKTRRMTLTYPAINSALHILFLVTGADKAATLKEVLQGPVDAARLPSQAALAKDGETIWVLDKAAGAQL